MPQSNQSTNQQNLTPMQQQQQQQQQQAPTQPQQSAHPGYSGMFFDDVSMGHHATPKEAVKPSVKDSQHNVVHGNAGGMQMPHPHPYAVPQQHTQQTAPTQPTYKQPQAASSQSKFEIYALKLPNEIKVNTNYEFNLNNCFIAIRLITNW